MNDPPANSSSTSNDNGLSIIAEDQDVLVVCKPAGLGTQAPIKFDSLESRVRSYLAETCDSKTKAYLGIPHRLDRCVSGVVVFAKRRKAAQRLSQQFELRTVEKKYLAIVAGKLTEDSGEWRDYLRKIPDEPRGEVVNDSERSEYPDAKLAILRYEVQKTTEQHSELNIELETGRMHQIRLQAAKRDLPVWGDVLYGSEVEFGNPPAHERDRQIALHAVQLTFDHPRSRDRVTFVAPLPSHWPVDGQTDNKE